MKIIITEEQLKFLTEQEDYTLSPSTDTKITPEEKFVPEQQNCYNIVTFIDQKISEMLKDNRSKEYIIQILTSNVKLENLSSERQDQIDPYNILRSDILKELRSKKGNVTIQRLISDCSKNFSFDKNVIKNKSVFKDLKINVVELKRGSSDPQGAQCGRPNWGKASAACMKPLFTGPQYK